MQSLSKHHGQYVCAFVSVCVCVHVPECAIYIIMFAYFPVFISKQKLSLHVPLIVLLAKQKQNQK